MPLTTPKPSRLSRLQLVRQGSFPTLTEEGRKIIPLDLLVEDPHNERKVFRNMDGLISTVKAVGVIEPLTVVPHKGGKYMITTGHRRFRAAQAAGLKQVTVIVSDEAAEATRRRKSIISNVQREDIGPVEMAEGLQALMDEDKTIATQRELGRVIGKRESWVSDMLRVLSLPATLQRKLRTSEVSIPYDAVMRIARVPGQADQSRLIDALLAGATNREIREQIDALKGKPKSAHDSDSVKKPKAVYTTDHKAVVIIQSLTAADLKHAQRLAALKQALRDEKHRR